MVLQSLIIQVRQDLFIFILNIPNNNEEEEDENAAVTLSFRLQEMVGGKLVDVSLINIIADIVVSIKDAVRYKTCAMILCNT